MGKYVIGRFIAISAVLGASVHAQDVQEIIKRHIDARGGYDAIKAVKTRKIVKRGEYNGSPLTATAYHKRPDQYRMEQKLHGNDMIRAVNPKNAWVRMSEGRIMQRPGFAATHMREGVGDIDDILVDFEKKGHEVRLEGTAEVNGKPCFKLGVDLKSGAVQTLYLDTTSYLMAKRERTYLTPRGDVPVEIEYDDYRKVGGLMFAHRVKQIQPDYSLTLTQTVELNVDLDDSIFEMPNGGERGPGGIGSKIKTDDGQTRLWARGDRESDDAEWFDFTDALIPWKQLGAGIGKDAISSIDDPVFVAPDDPRLLSMIPTSHYRRNERPATNDEIKVIGHVEGKDARAYPIALLDRHELVNDRVGGKPVTVGW